MNILHLTPNYYPSPGGLQAVFQNVSERLVAQYQDQVSVFTTNAMESVHSAQVNYLPIGKEVINGVQVQRFPFTRRWIPWLKQIIKLNHYLPVPGLAYWQLWRTGPISRPLLQAVRQARPDVILAGPFNCLHMYYPRRGRVPLVYMGALHVPKDEYIHPMIIRAINRANAYIAFTDYERDVLLRCGVDPAKLHVVGLGIDLTHFQQGNGQRVRQQYGFGNDPVVAYVGRLAAYKGVDTLIMAMSLVWPLFPQARLFIIGVKTDFDPVLQKLLDALPSVFRDRVTFINQSYADADAPHLFAASDVFVTVSSAESFGIVYLEAWACHKPVIGSRIEAVASVIQDKEDGLLVGCGEVEELAQTIVFLLQNPGERQRLGENGYRKVLAHYTWDRVTENIRDIYQQVQSAHKN